MCAVGSLTAGGDPPTRAWPLILYMPMWSMLSASFQDSLFSLWVLFSDLHSNGVF